MVLYLENLVKKHLKMLPYPSKKKKLKGDFINITGYISLYYRCTFEISLNNAKSPKHTENLFINS